MRMVFVIATTKVALLAAVLVEELARQVTTGHTQRITLRLALVVVEDVSSPALGVQVARIVFTTVLVEAAVLAVAAVVGLMAVVGLLGARVTIAVAAVVLAVAAADGVRLAGRVALRVALAAVKRSTSMASLSHGFPVIRREFTGRFHDL